MTGKTQLDLENQALLKLSQSFIGVISSNFRSIRLKMIDGVWNIHVVLRLPSSVDEEEIDDACSDFEGFYSEPTPYRVIVEVSEGDIILSHDGWRTMFRSADR